MTVFRKDRITTSLVLTEKSEESGGSGAEYQECGSVKLLTMEDLKEQLLKHDNDFDAFIKSTGMHYVEAQLWTDKYITEEYMIK